VTLGSAKNAVPSGTGLGVHAGAQDVGSTGLLPAKPKPHWHTLLMHKPGAVLLAEPQSVSITHANVALKNTARKSTRIILSAVAQPSLKILNIYTVGA
jgi:hypothetical protein